MKTYCKGLVVSDTAKIENSIDDYFHNKYKKNSTVRFISGYASQSREYVRENFKPGSSFWKETLHLLSEEMAANIEERTMKEHILMWCQTAPAIRYTKITDKGSGKIRDLGLETVLFRLYEAVAGDAAKPLWKAKFGTYQVASIKGRGQSYGKKAVKKWLSSDADGTKYMTQCDIRRCYPSISHEKLRGYLKRDLHKSHELLYMFMTFIDLYEEFPNPESKDTMRGILIGSPVSKDLCNYFLSYAYHYASEKLVKISTRRGKAREKRLISHVIFYADDIVLFSGNKKDVHMAQRMLIEYMNKILDLDIKPDWKMTKAMYEDRNGKARGSLLDYMGFRFHGGNTVSKGYLGKQVKHRKTWVTIRKRIFLAARRKRKIFSDKLRKKIQVKMKFVQSVVSQFGWFKSTNMAHYRKKNRVDQLIKIARKIVSDYAKGKEYSTEKYYKMWRKNYA